MPILLPLGYPEYSDLFVEGVMPPQLTFEDVDRL